MTAHITNGDGVDEFTADIIPDGLCSVEARNAPDDRPAPMELGHRAAQRGGERAERARAIGADANINQHAG